MEFVGKTVKKDFKGFGNYKGVIDSYDSSTGFFKILYEDGDSEEADLSEITRLTSFSGVDFEKEKPPAKKVGRKPKRRRRIGRDSGKSSENLSVDVSLENCDEIETQLGQNQNVVDSVSGNGNLNDGLDLNRGSDLDVGAENGTVRGFIDLNLSVENEEYVGGEKREGKERGFDLNLGFDDENPNEMGGNLDACLGVGLESELQNGDALACQGTPNSATVMDTNNVNSRTPDLNLEEGCLGVIGNSSREDGNSGRRKRRKIGVETVLRRSARRAKVNSLIESNTSCALVADDANDLSGVTDDSERKPNSLPSLPVARLEKTFELPPVTELPPSTTKLNLEGVYVLDLFSVYSFLRSFSTLLYLSPFELEDFVSAMRSKVSNPLIDHTHVSILRALRKHLEFLANEGCESASDCLRIMNWDLLDVITWPTFMVEYLLINGSRLKPGFNLGCLNLFNGEYYKQSIELKVELLRCLCDNVIEVEVIRLELSKRMAVANASHFDRTTYNGLYRKNGISSYVPGDSCKLEDVEEEIADGNSDECCLCKMDGNLICCDGCPAAYHSKCVGIVASLLPEGDWYCPECAIGRPNFGAKPQKLVRGAELLGNDPYGRLYFSCFDYLLVSDYHDEASFHYYHKDDLSAVIQLLQSSCIFYGPILKAISQCWVISSDLHESKSDLESRNCTSKDEKIDGIGRKSSNVPGYSSPLFVAEAVKHSVKTEISLTSSEGSVEVLQANQLLPHAPGPGFTTACPGASARSVSSAKKGKKNHSLVERHKSVLKTGEDVLQGQDIDSYINRYSFAHTASSIVEELLRKPSDKGNVDLPKTEEEIISIQSKFILKKSSKLCWMTIQDLDAKGQKEKCGWCYCCRFPVEGRGCLFNFSNRPSLTEGLKAEFDAVLLKKNKKGHLTDVICYILAMEERLRGFLLGPWLSPQYTEFWRKSVLKASDVSSLKRPLLVLESNLRPLVLSADWWKHVDFVTKVGSATHFVAKSRVMNKNGVSRRKGRYAGSETKSLVAGGGLTLFWWRGGKVTRSLFSWKVAPHSLVLKAARKAGYIKLPGIHYPDGSEKARRSRCVAWRASVETSTSLEQLALQVRELDLFVRWDDIENTHPLSALDKDSQKSIRLFKKSIIRRKSVEGTHVKYLIDFGKRRCIPDVVVKHGTKLVESSDVKKKYWLEESHVPLHLLKGFEERRITRKAGKTKSSKVRKGGKALKIPLRKKGFDYLFSRAERADSYHCGHCNKNVPISEAVSCQHCNDFFHKRHVTKSSDAMTGEVTYTCHKCRAGENVKINRVGRKKKTGKLKGVKNLKVGSRGSSAILRPKLRKSGRTLAKGRELRSGTDRRTQCHEQQLSPRNTRVCAGMTLRRSARKANNISLQCLSTGGKKRKRNQSTSVAPKECPKLSLRSRRRTKIHYSFWLNGLLFSRKPNDKRAKQFKKRKILLPSDFSIGVDDPPKCSLCSEEAFSPASTYIGCETCGEWFHGDAFGLDEANVKSVIGFKCHLCLEKTPPICPVVDPGVKDSQGSPSDLVSPTEADCVHALHTDDISPDLMAVETIQNRNFHDNIASISDSELRVQNKSPTNEAAEVRAIENENGCLKSSLVKEDKNQPNESLSMPLHELESQSLASKEAEAEAGDIERKNEGLKANLSVASGESSTVEEDKTNSNETQLSLLDRVESQSPAGKETETRDIESQNVNLNDNVTTVSGEISTLEMNAKNPEGTQFVIHDEVESESLASKEVKAGYISESPASKEVKAGDIESHNGDMKAVVPTAYDENSILEVDKSIQDESKSMQIDA